MTTQHKRAAPARHQTRLRPMWLPDAEDAFDEPEEGARTGEEAKSDSRPDDEATECSAGA